MMYLLPWKLIKRKRILTFSLVSLCFLLLTSFCLSMLTGKLTSQLHKENNEDSLDYLNYDSVDAVHAMVRQMSSVNRLKNQYLLDQDNHNSNNDILDADYHKSHSKRSKRIRIGVGDYNDIPNNVPKKYAFIHKEQLLKSKRRIPAKAKEPTKEAPHYQLKLDRIVDNELEKQQRLNAKDLKSQDNENENNDD